MEQAVVQGRYAATYFHIARIEGCQKLYGKPMQLGVVDHARSACGAAFLFKPEEREPIFDVLQKIGLDFVQQFDSLLNVQVLVLAQQPILVSRFEDDPHCRIVIERPDAYIEAGDELRQRVPGDKRLIIWASADGRSGEVAWSMILSY